MNFEAVQLCTFGVWARYLVEPQLCRMSCRVVSCRVVSCRAERLGRCVLRVVVAVAACCGLLSLDLVCFSLLPFASVCCCLLLLAAACFGGPKAGGGLRTTKVQIC